jgi:glucose/arabinose dehydrogenase
MKWRALSVGALGCLLVLGLATSVQAQGPVFGSAHLEYSVVTVAEGFDHPWSIAFLPNGDMLVTERTGRLRIVRNGVLLPDPVEGVPEVRARGQGGLLEVLPHPDFESNRLLYLSFSKPGEAGDGTTAIVRGRLEGNRLSDVEEIFEARAWSRSNIHFGSKLVFDSEGYLFITVGERGATPSLLEDHPAQDRSNHQGTVIRLHDDGSIPEDNPFVGEPGMLPEIWSYGHRNLQGLAIHPDTGDLWETEHGPQGGDELNVIRPGSNYGWPVIGYGVNYGRDRIPIHESTHREGMEQPVHYWVPSIATSGLMFYTGDRFDAWKGSVFVGGLAGQQIARLTLDGQRVVAEETLVEGLGRIRDIRQGPDGYIYIAIDARRGGLTPVVRLEPTTSEN